MLGSLVDTAVKPLARYADRRYGDAVGIRNYMRLGRAYSRVCDGKYLAFRHDVDLRSG